MISKVEILMHKTRNELKGAYLEQAKLQERIRVLTEKFDDLERIVTEQKEVKDENST